MYFFVDSIEVSVAFGSVSIDLVSDREPFIVEIELTDFKKSLRPDATLGIAVALDKALHCDGAPVIIAAEREYEELEDWTKLLAMKQVFLCLKPLTHDKAEEVVKKALSQVS